MVGINELENKFNLSIYPNPIANENTTLTFELTTNEKVEVTLIPYHLWNNRGPGEMVVWLKESQQDGIK